MRLELLGSLRGYFDTSSISSVDDLKKQYYKLAKKYHPDHGGSKEAFQELSGEYERLLDKMLSGAGLDNEEKSNEIMLDENLRSAYFAVMSLPNIVIELAGKWLWISGTTYPIRNELKAAGFMFAPKKKMWYYKGVESSGRGNYSIDEIRNKFGSQRLDTRDKNDHYLSGVHNSHALIIALRTIKKALDRRKIRVIKSLNTVLMGLGVIKTDNNVLITKISKAFPALQEKISSVTQTLPASTTVKDSNGNTFQLSTTSSGKDKKILVNGKISGSGLMVVRGADGYVYTQNSIGDYWKYTKAGSPSYDGDGWTKSTIAPTLPVTAPPVPQTSVTPPVSTAVETSLPGTPQFTMPSNNNATTPVQTQTSPVSDPPEVNYTEAKTEKDNTMLYVGLGIGATVLIGGGILLSGGGKKKGLGRVKRSRKRKTPTRRRAKRKVSARLRKVTRKRKARR